MKLTYTRSRYDDAEETFEPKDGPYEIDLAQLLFVEFGRTAMGAPWFGVMPPFEILSEILAAGGAVDGANVSFGWTPFSLSMSEYEGLIEEVKSHPEWRMAIEFPPDKDEDWSHWAVVRALEKRTNVGST